MGAAPDDGVRRRGGRRMPTDGTAGRRRARRRPASRGTETVVTRDGVGGHGGRRAASAASAYGVTREDGRWPAQEGANPGVILPEHDGILAEHDDMRTEDRGIAQQRGGLRCEHGEITAWRDGLGWEHDAMAQEHGDPGRRHAEEAHGLVGMTEKHEEPRGELGEVAWELAGLCCRHGGWGAEHGALVAWHDELAHAPQAESFFDASLALTKNSGSARYCSTIHSTNAWLYCGDDHWGL